MPGLFKATRLILILGIGLITTIWSPSCQSKADTIIIGEKLSPPENKIRKASAWTLLGGGIILVIAGMVYYVKGAWYGLTEDYDGSPVIIKNRVLTAGKIMVATGVAGVIACAFLFYMS